MSELPEGWIEVLLRDVAEISSGIGFPKEFQGEESGDLPFFKVGDISRAVVNNRGQLSVTENYVSQETARKLKGKPLKPGTTVFAKIGEAIKLSRRAFVQSPCLVDNNVMGVKAHDDRLDRLLFLFLQTQDFSDLSRATTVPSLRKGDIESLVFPLPPLAEQKRIADKLDALLARVDRARARLDRVPLILKRFRQAVLAAATSGQLTEDWRGENGNVETAVEMLSRISRLSSHSAKQKELFDSEGLNSQSDLPDTWQLTSVESIGEVLLGRQRSPENHNGPYMRPYMRAANITWNGWNLSDVMEMNFDPGDFEKFALKVGDVLINEGSGSADEVGKPAIWKGEIENCCFQNTLLCVRPYENMSKYLYFMFLQTALSKAFVNETL